MPEVCGESNPDHPEVTCTKPMPCWGMHFNLDEPDEDKFTWPGEPEPTQQVVEETGLKPKDLIRQASHETRQTKTAGSPTYVPPPPPGHRDGVTYSPTFDYDRLNRLQKLVYDCLKDGTWWTPPQVEEHVASVLGPEATHGSSLTARIRDFRKEKFGGFIVDKRRVVGGSGLWEYRLLPPPSEEQIEERRLVAAGLRDFG